LNGMPIQLHATEQGSGFPLILLHGNGESAEYFSNQMDCFARSFHVIALDTRGHGQTPRGDAPFTLDQFAQDLLEFMDARQIEKAHLLGFSDGGNIALLFALHHPERVERLILNGANLSPKGVKKGIQLSVVLGYEAACALSQIDRRAVAKREMLGLMVNQPNIDPAELSRLPMPTLVVAGERDMILEDHTKLIARSIPHATLCILPGDHFVAAKNSEAFNKQVMDFLQTVPAARS